jgi:hypothetical protein
MERVHYSDLNGVGIARLIASHSLVSPQVRQPLVERIHVA